MGVGTWGMWGGRVRLGRCHPDSCLAREGEGVAAQDTGGSEAVRSPSHRFYLVSGGAPFIICGVTAATNIRNYGMENEASA